MEQIITEFLTKYPALEYVLLALGSLLILGQAYVAITPKQEDDAWFAKLEANPTWGFVFSWLRNFAPIQRSDKNKK